MNLTTRTAQNFRQLFALAFEKPASIEIPLDAITKHPVFSKSEILQKAVALTQPPPQQGVDKGAARTNESFSIPKELDCDEKADAKLLATRVILLLSWAIHQNKLPDPAISHQEAVRATFLLNQLNAPYYLRYLVNSRLFCPTLFHQYKEMLSGPGMELHPGHTQQQRIDAIIPTFPGGNVLVDIGCGKATYLRVLGERYFSAIGFEKDEATRNEAAYVLRKQNIVQAKVFAEFSFAWQIPSGAHVLMTEVMEHIPKQEALAILGYLGHSKASLILLTAPNREFNKHYNLPGEAFRHWDHQWEPDEAEFRDIIQQSFGKQWRISLLGIGDSVFDVSATLGCVAEKIEPKALW